MKVGTMSPFSLMGKSGAGELFLIEGSAGPFNLPFPILAVQHLLSDCKNMKAIVFSKYWKMLDEAQKKQDNSCHNINGNSIEIIDGTSASMNDIRSKCQSIKSDAVALDFFVIDDYSDHNDTSIFTDTDLTYLKSLAIELNVLICVISNFHKDHKEKFSGSVLLQIGMAGYDEENSQITTEMIAKIEAKALKKLKQKKRFKISRG